MKETETRRTIHVPKTSRNHSRINPLRPLAGLLAAGLSVPALAQSVPFPTYQPRPQTNGTFSSPATAQIITPAGTQVNLGTTTRAKAIALNPPAITPPPCFRWAPRRRSRSSTPRPALCCRPSSRPIGAGGSSTGITYTPDGKYLLFSQDGDYGLSYVAVASVSSSGTLTNFANIAVPLGVDATGKFDQRHLL